MQSTCVKRIHTIQTINLHTTHKIIIYTWTRNEGGGWVEYLFGVIVVVSKCNCAICENNQKNRREKNQLYSDRLFESGRGVAPHREFLSIDNLYFAC